MFKKKEKTEKAPKNKKVRTMKVGTHKKSVLLLWAVLLASTSFAYYVKDGVLAPVSGDYVFSELVNPVFTKESDNLKVSVSVKYLDNKSKMTQVMPYDVFNPKARNLYWKYLTHLYQMGFDAWWTDSTEPALRPMVVWFMVNHTSLIFLRTTSRS